MTDLVKARFDYRNGFPDDKGDTGSIPVISTIFF